VREAPRAPLVEGKVWPLCQNCEEERALRRHPQPRTEQKCFERCQQILVGGAMSAPLLAAPGRAAVEAELKVAVRAVSNMMRSEADE
jgi:hypothetical protein